VYNRFSGDDSLNPWPEQLEDSSHGMEKVDCLKTYTMKQGCSACRRVALFAAVTLLTQLTLLADSVSNTYSSTAASTAGSTGGGGGIGSINMQTAYYSGSSRYVWKFDNRLGTLNSMTISLTTDYSVNSSFYYKGSGPASPGDVSERFKVSPRLFDASNQTFISYDLNTSAGGTIPVNGGLVESMSLHYSTNITLSDPTILARFQNNREDMCNLYITDTQMYNSSAYRGDGGPYSGPWSTYTYTITYDFTPVPEPGTMTLGVVGLLGMAGLSLRLRRKQITS
jgi:PEP-CTERM motif